MSEIEEKLACLRALLAGRDLDAALLARSANFAWLTGGASAYVNTATDNGAASLLVTPDAQYVLTTNIEAPRLRAEEALETQGFQLRAAPWYEPNPALAELTAGLHLGADVAQPGALDIVGGLKLLRLHLTPAEGERFRVVGRLCAEAMDAAIRQVRPGMSEYEIAGLLAGETRARGALPIVNLIATDERIYNFRHPLPTDKKLNKYAMLVLCGRRQGLVASVTRLVHFGPLPAELQRKQAACVQVDATFLARTRAGALVSSVFEAAVQAYAATGFPDEWKRHHQGGPIGYEPREYTANAASGEAVYLGQAYAWNPSIAGVKTEDTTLVGAEANEVLTTIAGWPTIPVEIDGQTYRRPAILEL
jgi:Xaa-Pro aminopeptidase